MRLDGFNAEEIQPDSFDALPAGWYEVMIVESENKETKAGTGSYLQLTLEVVSGEHRGRKLWDRLNLDNPNSTAVEIAQKTLSAICRAVGVLRPQDSAELHDKLMLAKVISKKYEGEDRNEIKGYKEAGAKAPAASRGASSDVPAWKRGA